MKNEEPLYVGIADPNDLRKELLHSSKVIINNLKSSERLAIIRDERESAVTDLKKLIREINVLNKRLKQSMPQSQFKIQEKKLEDKTPKKVVKVVNVNPEAKKISTSRLSELEDELALVEQKLKSLE